MPLAASQKPVSKPGEDEMMNPVEVKAINALGELDSKGYISEQIWAGANPMKADFPAELRRVVDLLVEAGALFKTTEVEISDGSEQAVYTDASGVIKIYRSDFDETQD
jgi:hypothetical protein